MATQDKQFIVDGQWILGCDTLLYPTDIAQGGYQWGVNVINRGGVVQTRPGRKRVLSFCGRKAQGLHWCRTLDDQNFLLVAIDGSVYVSPYPFSPWTSWTKLAGVTFLADAERIWFCTSEQAVYYDSGNFLVIMPQPQNIVTMQDGVSTPCYWNAATGASGQIVSNPTTIANHIVTGSPVAPMRTGTVMVWKDNRLWLAADNLVYASDLLYPTVFTEDTYLAEQSGFRFPRSVQNMIANPIQGLLVLTDSSMHTLQSFIQDRTKWSTTERFQDDVNVEVGLAAPWAIAYLHGMPWLFTARGVISYDRALTTNLTTVIMTADGEMQRSKNLLSPDIQHACMGTWENVLMVAVPASSLYNRHTWIMDAGIAQKLNIQSGMCWTGVWTGTYPVQFASPIIHGIQHNYELSYSGGYLATSDSPSPMLDTGHPSQAYIHLWENCTPNQVDACEGHINCSLETRAYVLASDDYYRFVFCEIMLVNLKGVVPIQVYVTGLAGNYQLLFATTLRADIGPWGNPTDETVLYYIAGTPVATTLFETYRKQVRHLRTSEFVVQGSADNASCIEINRLNGIDKAFQLLLRWQGRLGIRQIKFFYDRQLQVPTGACPVDESTTPNIVLEATV